MIFNNRYLVASLIVFVAVMLVCLFAVMNLIHPGEIYTLPILAVSAIIITVGVLSLTGIAYTYMGSKNFAQAFALPDGTIRAVIALSFIVLFAIMSFYAFSKLTANDVSALDGLDPAQVDDVKKSLGHNFIAATSAPDKTVRIVYFQPVNPSGIDFTKQMFILLGTLVTSISSFYFGSASTKGADNNRPGPASPIMTASKLKSISPETYATTPAPSRFEFDLIGDNLDATKEVKLTLKDAVIVAEYKVSSSSVLNCAATIGPNQKGEWNIVLTDKSGSQSELRGRLNVT